MKKKLFPNKEAFKQIHEKCLENQPYAPMSLQNAERSLRNSYWRYLAELETHTFRYAYQCGYEAAMKDMEGGTAV